MKKPMVIIDIKDSKRVEVRLKVNRVDLIIIVKVLLMVTIIVIYYKKMEMLMNIVINMLEVVNMDML